ncbi:energy-coupling factor transporter transmembrane component T family protein [Chloroflexota bacterium]
MIDFRYRDKGTAVHKLNPVCTLAWVGSIIVLALIFNHPLFLLCLFLSTLPLVIAARVHKEWLSFMVFAPFLCLGIIVINALVGSEGSHILAQAPFRIPVMGTPVITLEGIFYGAGMSLRLLVIISAFALLTFVVHPDDMMQMARQMRLPYKSVLVTSLSTRFVPTLFDDVKRIGDVQRSRGLELDRGRLVSRIRSRLAIVVPLLSNSLDRTVQVAEAMESRAFGAGTSRSFYKRVEFSRIDGAVLALALFPFAFGIFLRLSGYGDYQYYPTLGDIGLNGLAWAMLAVVVLLVSAILPIAYVKRMFGLD